MTSKLKNLPPGFPANDAILATILHKLDEAGIWPTAESRKFLEDLLVASRNKGDLTGASVGLDVLSALKELTRTKSKVEREP